MEVIEDVKKSSPSRPTARSSSFDCDPSAIDALLGVVSKSGIKANSRLKTTSVMQPLSGLSGRLSQRESDFTLPPGGSSEARGGYDPFCRSPKLRIDMPEAPAKQESRDTKDSRWGPPCYTDSRWGPPCYTEQLLRLLDRQQAWYDAQQQAARAAEQLLSLCEHHQQQWLQANPQNQPAPLPTQPAPLPTQPASLQT